MEKVIVALVDDSATVKRFTRRMAHIRLQSENVHGPNHRR